MGFQLTSLGHAKIAAGVVALGLLGYNYAEKQIDHYFNYQLIDSQVINVGKLCQLRSRDENVQAEIDTYSKWANGVWRDCNEATSFTETNIVKVNGKKHKIPIRYGTVATVRYISPVDSLEYNSQLHLGAYAEELNLQSGQSFSIYASLTDPTTTDLK